MKGKIVTKILELSDNAKKTIETKTITDETIKASVTLKQINKSTGTVTTPVIVTCDSNNNINGTLQISIPDYSHLKKAYIRLRKNSGTSNTFSLYRMYENGFVEMGSSLDELELDTINQIEYYEFDCTYLFELNNGGTMYFQIRA